MKTEPRTHRLDSCRFFQEADGEIICVNPQQHRVRPICAVKPCKYYEPKDGDR